MAKLQVGISEELPGTMEQASEDVVDQFQATVYNAGSKALSMLDADALTKGLEIDRRKKAKDTLRHLGAFRYNIGFRIQQFPLFVFAV